MEVDGEGPQQGQGQGQGGEDGGEEGGAVGCLTEEEEQRVAETVAALHAAVRLLGRAGQGRLGEEDVAVAPQVGERMAGGVCGWAGGALL